MFEELSQFVINHPMITIGWFGCIIGIIYTYIMDAVLGVKYISNSILSVMINNQNAKVLDFRPLENFRKGHISGSVHCTEVDIQEHNLGKKIESHKEAPLVLVNDNGLNLQDYARTLKKQGFTNISILREGIDGWLNDNLMLVKK